MNSPANTIIWKDIVRIGGENGTYHAESAPVKLCGNVIHLNNIYLGNTEAEIQEKLKDADDGCFDVDDFIAAMAAKYSVNTDAIELITFENFDIPESVMLALPWGEESCGGYINGLSV